MRFCYAATRQGNRIVRAREGRRDVCGVGKRKCIARHRMTSIASHQSVSCGERLNATAKVQRMQLENVASFGWLPACLLLYACMRACMCPDPLPLWHTHTSYTSHSNHYITLQHIASHHIGTHWQQQPQHQTAHRAPAAQPKAWLRTFCAERWWCDDEDGAVTRRRGRRGGCWQCRCQCRLMASWWRWRCRWRWQQRLRWLGDSVRGSQIAVTGTAAAPSRVTDRLCYSENQSLFHVTWS